MMKALFIGLAMLALVACGGQAQAANNNFTSGVSAYSAYEIQMATVTPAGFVLQYADGNVSDLFPDVGGAQFARLKSFAPGLKNLVQVGASGVYINPDQAKRISCQYGTGSAEPTAQGDHLYILWGRNWNVVADTNCATLAAIRAAGN